MRTPRPDDIVKSCFRLESGLRFGTDAVYACCIGAADFPPPYFSAEEVRAQTITKEMIVEKRRELFDMLNDDHSDIFCKRCVFVVERPFKEVRFDQIGHVDLAHYTTCNLRCSYCSYTVDDHFVPPQYDALKILQEFRPEDSQWDAFVDLNGGEPSLLKNLDQYLHFFERNRIRILLYSNALRYRQEIYDGVKSGTISWLIVGLDSGTPSTYKAMKKSSKYQSALDNITRYAHAGSFSRGSVAVKYVFCDANTGMDDVMGFAYAMLAIRPQKIWLTIDFLPVRIHERETTVDDYSPHIEAYAQTYVLLKRHGIDPVHYTEQHAFSTTAVGSEVVQRIKQRIAELMPQGEIGDPHLLLEDFRFPRVDVEATQITYDFGPLRQIAANNEIPWSLKGKRVMIAAIWRNSAALVADPDIRQSDFIGFLDRNPALTGTKVHGHPVFDYDQLSSLKPDVVLVDASRQNRNDIVAAVNKVLGRHVIIAVLGRETNESSYSRETS